MPRKRPTAQPSSVAIAAVLLWTVHGALAANVTETIDGWHFSNGREYPGATGFLRHNPDEGHGAPGCVEVQFSFVGGGNYVAAMAPAPADESVRRVRLWLKKPGRNRITFRGVDRTGQTFQKFIEYRYPDWQQIEVNLDTWVQFWGGPADGTVRRPFKQFGVLIENDGEAKEGSYYIDDIEYLPAPAGAPADAMLRSTYTAFSFDADERWRASHGGKLDGSTWTYSLPDAGARTAVHAGVSLLGRPLRMRVVVESDGSGHELVAELASHFQHFDHTLGTLSRPGTQTFEVELGDMGQWRHFGGEDDGMVRLPLRFQSLSLVRCGDKAEGAIRLRSIEVDTEYTPEQSVVIIPDVQLAGDDAGLTVVLRNLSAEPVAGTLFWEIRDTVGPRQTQQQPLTLPGGAKPVVREMTCSMGERVFAEAVFRFVAEAFRTPEASITAVRAPAGPVEPGPTNPIGVGMYLYRYQGAHDAPEKMQALADMARRAGVKWTREEFQWHTTEPERGRYHWDFYDELVRAAERNDIRVYGLLAYWSGYAYHEKIAYTEQGVDEYARWAGQVVRRYKDRIKHWEVWNEPNIFFWSGPKPLYGTMLKKAYAAIKAADPEAQVLGCSTAGIDVAFIQKVLEWKAPFDVLTVHPYRGQLNETAFIDELKRTSELVDGRSVWITEMGWSSEIGATSERDQAGLVARTYLSALASGVVGSVSWYDFRDDGADPFYNEHNFGLLRHDLRPKAGYRALATVGSLLARHEAVGAVQLSEGLLAFRFTAPGEDVIALWSTTGGQLVALRVSPEATKVFDAMGQTVPIGDDGQLVTTLPAGWPLYLVGKNGLTADRRPVPVRLIAEPTIVRPGGVVGIQIETPPGWSLSAWHQPAGWRLVEPASGGGAELHVPEDQPQGRVEFQAEFRAGGQIVYVPFGVYVQPALLRS